MTHDNGAYVKLTHRGAEAHIAPSGVSIKQTPGAHEPPYPRAVVFLDLGDLRRIIERGMADGGWADWFRAELREAFNAR